MIHTQIALLQRELWEHKSVLVVPVVVALVTLLTWWTSKVTIGELEYLDIGIISAGNMPENVRAAALSFTMIGLAVSFINGSRVCCMCEGLLVSPCVSNG